MGSPLLIISRQFSRVRARDGHRHGRRPRASGCDVSGWPYVHHSLVPGPVSTGLLTGRIDLPPSQGGVGSTPRSCRGSSALTRPSPAL
jgi:hypothetical protein